MNALKARKLYQHTTGEDRDSEASRLIFWTLYYLDRSYAVAFMEPYLIQDKLISLRPPTPPLGDHQTHDAHHYLDALAYGEGSSDHADLAARYRFASQVTPILDQAISTISSFPILPQ